MAVGTTKAPKGGAIKRIETDDPGLQVMVLQGKVERLTEAVTLLVGATEHLLNQSQIYVTDKREIRERIVAAKAILAT